MADLEDGEILDSSDEEMQNDTQKRTELKANASEHPLKNPDLKAFSGRQDVSKRVSAIRSAESSGYRSNTPDTVGSDSSHDSDSEEDTPLWRQKKAKYFRTQLDQNMAVRASPTLPEYKPQSPQTAKEPPAKKRKNNIWGSVLEEQDLTQSFVRSGQMVETDSPDFIERSVESYHRDIKKYRENVPDLDEKDLPEKIESNDPFDKVLDSHTSKISRSLVDYQEGFEDLNPGQSVRKGVKRKAEVKERLGIKSGVKDRIGTKTDAKDKKGNKFQDRLGKDKMEVETLGEINFSAEMDEAELIQKVAEYLHEAKVEIIERCMSCLGKEEVMDLVRKTKDVEDSGGLMTKDRERRRTPGGVFIQMMKYSPNYTPEVNKVIFKEDLEEKMMFRKQQRQLKRRNRKERLQKLQKQHERMQQSSEQSKKRDDSKPQNIRTLSNSGIQREAERSRSRSWSTESEASSSENEMDTGDKRSKNKSRSGEMDFQAELEKTKKLILRTKSKENTDCTMEEGQIEEIKEAKSVESLPENKENLEDSGMNDLLEEESNIVDIPLE